MNNFEYDYYNNLNVTEARLIKDNLLVKAKDLIKKGGKDGKNLFDFESYSGFATANMNIFYKEECIQGAYIYQKNGGWYADILLNYGDENFIIGTPNDHPHLIKDEATAHAINHLAMILEYEDGNLEVKDKSGVPDGFIDFRLYYDRYHIPILFIDDMKNHFFNDDEYNISDSIEEASNLINQQMALPDCQRDKKVMFASMVILMIMGIHFVNYPIGWQGEGTDIVNDLLSDNPANDNQDS